MATMTSSYCMCNHCMPYGHFPGMAPSWRARLVPMSSTTSALQPLAESIEAGGLLRRLQRGERLSMPESRSMPDIGPRCHELRIDDVQHEREWRVTYHVGRHAIAVLDVVAKSTRATPGDVIASCRRRLARFRKVDES